VKAPKGFLWTIPGEIDRVHDGDTVICHLLLHPNEGGEAHEVNVRLEGINAPELNTAEGIAARDYLRTLLPSGTPMVIVSRRRDKYGRFLGRVVLLDGTDVSTMMLIAGHAIPYMT
jgi:endonuclease YncB( thermonuclease family)